MKNSFDKAMAVMGYVLAASAAICTMLLIYVVVRWSV